MWSEYAKLASVFESDSRTTAIVPRQRGDHQEKFLVGFGISSLEPESAVNLRAKLPSRGTVRTMVADSQLAKRFHYVRNSSFVLGKVNLEPSLDSPGCCIVRGIGVNYTIKDFDVDVYFLNQHRVFFVRYRFGHSDNFEEHNLDPKHLGNLLDYPAKPGYLEFGWDRMHEPNQHQTAGLEPDSVFDKHSELVTYSMSFRFDSVLPLLYLTENHSGY